MSNGYGMVALGEWLGRSDWMEDYLSYEAEFAEFFEVLTRRSYAESWDRLAEHYEESLGSVFLESYLASQVEGTILKEFRESGFVELSQGQLGFLRAVWKSIPSIYEVHESVGGSHLILKDMIREGELIKVQERSASQSLATWDLLLTRVISVQGVKQITGGTIVIPRVSWPFLSSEIKRQIKSLTKELPAAKRVDARSLAEIRDEAAFTMNWYALASWLVAATPQFDSVPRMVNRDHDDIEFVSLAYPIKVNAEVISQALEDSEDFSNSGLNEWSWLIDIQGESIIHGNLRIVGDRLLAECNSENRGMRLTERLSELLGEHIGTPLKLETSLEELSKMRTEPVPTLMETLGPQERVELAGHMQKLLLDQYMRTIDNVVPMLGASPRELVRTKAGREKVVNWLKLLENSHAHAPKELHGVEFDATPLWKELGLLKFRT